MTPLPPDLASLFPGGADGRSLTVPLPPGRLIEPEDGGDPVYWLSDAPPPPGLWSRLLAEHPRSGLWPLLLGGLHSDESRPWRDGEVYPGRMSSPDRFEAAAVLAEWWGNGVPVASLVDGTRGDAEFQAATPSGLTFPGLAPTPPAVLTPTESAEHLAASLLTGTGFATAPLLGLVAAPRGADTLAITGWSGPANWENDTAKHSAVLRDWETRFGARVVGVEFATLHVSIANPPSTVEQALPVAAEHYAFCNDNVGQGPGTLQAYADTLVNQRSCAFWWD